MFHTAVMWFVWTSLLPLNQISFREKAFNLSYVVAKFGQAFNLECFYAFSECVSAKLAFTSDRAGSLVKMS